ncbi:MAG: UDP-3-O-(3-hydroxymyristoyl)glucosamine N-acyltransferase [Silicimonas sp.]|nr:UDP-3-O-(3-hydroxymyristoyl)glucosamine N-acyltransferase [Silicimonas sp.]NNL72756.1 UDP-3-O-(3-hydroxymyristoyl)glucosamine N-acyltransferase [Silicimonas sp.]
MGFTIKDIAQALDAVVFGASDVVVTGAAEPAMAGPDDLALAMDPKYAEGLASGQARAAIVWDGADWQALGLEAAIVVPRPRYAMSGVTALLDPGPEIAAGIHPSAVVDPTAEIGDGAAIGPLVVIGPRAAIGANARIASHASIAEDARIGADVLIHAGVRIGARVRLGDRVIVQPGAVIGADGFSFVTPETSRVEEARQSLGTGTAAQNSGWTRIHSLGSVVVGDDVEIGANSTIDAGTIRPTRIGNRTKIDNQVMIGHNCVVGEDSLLCAHVGVSGSVKVGNRVVLAGKVGVSDNIFIGDDVVAGGGTNIYTNVPAGRTILGSPAVKMETELEIRRELRRLPRLANDVRALKKAVSNDTKDD